MEKMHNTEARRKQREARTRSNEALLHRAARIGDIVNVKRAIDLGVDVNCTGSNHDTGAIIFFSFEFQHCPQCFSASSAPLTIPFCAPINKCSSSCGLYKWKNSGGEISS